MEKALFGAGCFWGVEETFRKLPGVKNTEVGYCGGTTVNPSYESVCQGNTNHPEVVLLEFEENEISFKILLDHFWKCHDPTTLNRQGPDIGTQYRSVIFYFNEDQKIMAQDSKEIFSSCALNSASMLKKSSEKKFLLFKRGNLKVSILEGF